MSASCMSFVEILTSAGFELNFAAWLLIGSVQMGLLAIVASG